MFSPTNGVPPIITGAASSGDHVATLTRVRGQEERHRLLFDGALGASTESVRHASHAVLLLSYEDDDLGVKKEVRHNFPRLCF
jgi:hypothetical protein